MNRPRSLLWPFLRRQWRALLIAAVATLIVTGADLAQPFPLALVIDRLVDKPRHGFQLTSGDVVALGAIAGLVLAIAVADALAQYWMDISLDRAGERILHDLRTATYAQLQRLSLAFHERQHTGDLSTLVTGDVQAIGSLFSDALGTIVSSALLLVGMVVVTIVLDPVVALAAFCVTPVLAFVTFRFRRRLRHLSRQQRRKDGEIASIATETLSAMRVVKAFGSEDFEHDRLRRTSEQRRQFGIEAAQLEGRYSGFVDLLGAISTAVVLVVGVLRVAGGHLSLGGLVVVTSYARKAYKPLRAIARQANAVSKTMARAERVADVLAADELLTEVPNAYRGPRADGDLRLEDVAFSYASDRPALRDLSVHVPAGRKVAVVGASGAGKSTLAVLVARFYDPTEGRVLLDGRDVRSCSLAWLREQVALVLQDTVLFTGDVTENIAYGFDASRERVLAAAKAAGAHAFITQLPEGYETALGPRGLSLSGGQRQRIAIARALLRDPSILVLDEPTSGLDAESETQVVRGLDVLMRGRTTVIITHSLALARRADHVVVLDDGQVIEEGPPDELLAADGRFRRLAAEQGLAPRGSRAAAAIHDPGLPHLATLLDAGLVAPVLQRSLHRDDPPDVRVRHVRYRVGSSVCVHYDVGVDGTWYEAVVLAKPGDRLARAAQRTGNLELARRVDGRSPSPTPLAYEPEVSALVQWLPLDLWLPVLAESPDALCAALHEAGIRGVSARTAQLLGYHPRQRAVLRLDDHVVKAYGKQPDFEAAYAALRAARHVHDVTTPVLNGAVADQRLIIQSLVSGRRLTRPDDAAADAGQALASLHAAPLLGLRRCGPGEHLKQAATTCHLIAGLAPWLAGRVDVLLGTLELTAPSGLEFMPAHGDFHAGQLLDRDDELAIIELDRVCFAPPALDVATYGAHVVRGDDGDVDAAEEVMAAVIDGYGSRPDGLAWYLSTSILRRADLPFRYLDEHWPDGIESMVGAAEAAMSR